MEGRRLRLTGTVQGVGFRPFVVRLARRLELTGAVGNDDRGVWCDVQGDPQALDRFHRSLRDEAPPLANIVAITSELVPLDSSRTSFRVAASDTGRAAATLSVPPDVAPCDACRTELRQPDDRRHRYSFTCCTDCGPRFTVTTAVPYDRERTTMADFPLCPTCQREYDDEDDRRFHGQAICCPRCGPQLELREHGEPVSGDPITEAAARLQRGSILALKGVGGYQLVCSAQDEQAVATLRARKHREEKPFALLVADTEAARELIEVGSLERRALESPEAPIVLALRNHRREVAPSVAPRASLLGVMLPASPLHVLLAEAVAPTPLVCTSGNLSDEPIVIDDARAASRLHPIADSFLTHNRRIQRRADDSIVRVIGNDVQILRRARGHAPRPVRLHSVGPPVLGVGAELKSTVCLTAGSEAHVSVHLGDLEHPDAVTAFEATIADLFRLTRMSPELIVHDHHPEYLSTKFARSSGLAPTLGVQHHHAHLVSCLTEHGHPGPAIGITFDGLGLGTDGTMWGGEILVGDADDFTRVAHLDTVPMPGGAAAIREPWRMAVAHLHRTYGSDLPDIDILDRHADALDTILRQCSPDRSVMTSSMGRLFDAVAALCGLADRVSYEGQAAMRLEQAVVPETPLVFDGPDTHDSAGPIDTSGLVRQVVEALVAGATPSDVASAFHRWVADLTVELVRRASAEYELRTVVLSGGVMQNRVLVELLLPALSAEGVHVLQHRQVPPNDGGLSLGQVEIGRRLLQRGGPG